MALRMEESPFNDQTVTQVSWGGRKERGKGLDSRRKGGTWAIKGWDKTGRRRVRA